MEQVILRPAGEPDIPHLTQLETVSFSDPWSRTSLVDALNHTAGLVLVAEDSANDPPIVGYLVLRLTGFEAELLRIAVHPDRRLQGLGASLLQQAFTELASRQVETCFLEVRSDNVAALALYNRFPAHQIARRAKYYQDGTEALILSLEVASGARPDDS